jgi:hypothetical protein
VGIKSYVKNEKILTETFCQVLILTLLEYCDTVTFEQIKKHINLVFSEFSLESFSDIYTKSALKALNESGIILKCDKDTYKYNNLMKTTVSITSGVSSQVFVNGYDGKITEINVINN